MPREKIISNSNLRTREQALMKNKIATISELHAISYKDNGELLVDLEKIESAIICDYRRTNSSIHSILVRRSLADKLHRIQKQLETFDSRMQLIVVEGYRPFAYQENYYLKELVIQFQKNPTLDFQMLLEQTHQFVALPSVAGHPTGGAIDLTIACAGEELDMGTKIADFSLPHLLPTYSNAVNAEQKERRLLLHDLMLAEGFAPFYGEWWHFSFGDREWAAFYGLSQALYSPLII